MDSVEEAREVDKDDVRKAGDGGKQLADVDALKYTLTDTPPWYACVLLGLQHFLMMFLSEVSAATIVGGALCVGQNWHAIAKIISTVLFMAGMATLVQTTIGTRLPIVQGTSLAYLPGVFAIMSLPKWKCPSVNVTVTPTMSHEESVTGFMSSPFTMNTSNSTVLTGDSDEAWKVRMREIQGAMVTASLFEMVLGLTGILGPILRLISPLTVAVVIGLLGIAQLPVATIMCASFWPISVTTIVLIILFSQFLRRLLLPLPSFRRQKGCHITRYPVFLVFPLLLAVIFSWALCAILTASGALSEETGGFGNVARTDSRAYVIEQSPWIQIPYPFQWGWPTFSASAIMGMLAAVIASTVESIGDYYACARMCQVPPPPVHAINRGIGAEGIGCLFCAIFGSGLGTTSYSTNIAVIAVTKVASQRVVQVAGLWMLVLSILAKFGALFATMPEPIMGGTYIVYIGFLVSAGLANLQYVNLNSSRNMFVLGFSLCVGLSIPPWIRQNRNIIHTGSQSFDQVLVVLLSSEMLLGGLTAFIFDNAQPGTKEERGLTQWVKSTQPGAEGDSACDPYNLPYIMPYLRRHRWTTHIPFLPTYTEIFQCKRNKLKTESDINLGPNNTQNVNDISNNTRKDASLEHNSSYYQDITKL